MNIADIYIRGWQISKNGENSLTSISACDILELASEVCAAPIK